MTVKGGFALAAALAHGALAASTTTSAALTTSSPVLPASATDTCPTKFIRPSAYEWVRNAQPGWNLGNTLEAIPTEGSWNNPPVVPSTFDYVKEAGIKAVRIPVTYADHFISGSPDWIINATWLERVSTVVDEVTSRGLYAITNMHHDSWIWADVTQADANLTMIFEKFSAAWHQIGKTLACKSNLLALEPINEPPGTDAADGAQIDKLNALFLQALADTGNADRMVTLSGPQMSAEEIIYFTAPANVTNPWAFQFHYYSPYDFIFGAWGKTIWGSDSDKVLIAQDFAGVRGNLSVNASTAYVPVIMGEFEASQTNCEAAARWKWYDYVVHQAKYYGYAPFFWDNGLDNLDRSTGYWRDPIAINITESVLRGNNNSLADSTTDIEATSQWSSAYVFLQVGENLTDQTLPFILNGNTIRRITDNSGGTLTPGSDYTISGSNVTLHTSFLSKYLSPTGTPGSKTNLTVTFSSGAPSDIEIVQWDVPTISSTSSAAADLPSGDDLWIPVVWKGLHKVAACQILFANGTYFVDTWTVWLPPLQQARGTYSSQFNWGDSYLVIPNAAVQTVLADAADVTFTFEFYPRAEGNGNNVTYTVTA